MRIDKANGNVAFNEERHLYWDTGSGDRYVSVTTLIDRFKQDFDREFWASYKALEKVLPRNKFLMEKKELLRTKVFGPDILVRCHAYEEDFLKARERILAEWDEANRKSCERGRRMHAALESYSKEGRFREAVMPYLGMEFRDLPCHADPEGDRLDDGIFPELLVHYESPDGILKVAGQIDLLVKDGGGIYVVDYKGLPLDTPVPVVDGWTTMGEIKEGMRVFDKDGEPREVLHVSGIHHEPCCLIRFDTGETVTCDRGHHWLFNGGIVASAEEAMELLEKGPLYIEACKPVRMPRREDWPCAPYLAGLGLSEGVSPFGGTSIPSKFLRASESQRMAFFEGISGRAGKFRVDDPVVAGQVMELGSSLGLVLSPGRDGTVTVLPRKERKVVSISWTDTVPTRCIEVDGPTHTYLCGKNFLVTHNTNKEIRKASGFDGKKNVMMKYPLNNIMDCNFFHYALQLSTYAWILQRRHPDLDVKGLLLVHYAHDGEVDTHRVDYLKGDVTRMLAFAKGQRRVELEREKRERMEF